MAKLKLKSQTETGRQPSAHVTLGYDGRLDKIEVYAVYEGEWLGREFQADVTADRYMAGFYNNRRLTDWRLVIHLRGVETSALRAALHEAVDGQILRFVDSAEGKLVIERAYVNAIARIISGERFDAERAQRVRNLNGAHLSPESARKLDAAIERLRELLKALKEV